CMQGLEFPLIF
nr:immunoglobulin light chain junction region [Macaca mulatta]